jgi:SAM-dependent methyltransferase
MPVRFKPFYAALKDQEFRLLDVGCGYGSPAMTRRYFPRCRYYGIDRDPQTNRPEDLRAMEQYYNLDLDTDSLDVVPDEFFDVVLFSHVIEHLHNGLNVLAGLARKLRAGGTLYVEFPGLRSLRTPRASRPGDCLHFCDDRTHVRVYALHEVVNVLLDGGLDVVRAGTRRDPVRLLLTPALFLYGCLRRRPWNRALWDFFGFAEYAVARKLTPQRPAAVSDAVPVAARAGLAGQRP